MVVPLTTKTESKVISKSFRSEFNVLGKKSYIMWDAVQKINNTEVKCLYSKNGKILNLSGAAKEYIRKESIKKIFNWVNSDK
ncbi:hypothetical protein [Spiroplasma endosymbiont of Atherix ibis]|uniref:hypothetical protein n=1 Tax=Spiroplasma endosymbiont of Atherix ibis TaxID=3066291 RepID=UPI0030CA7CC0